MVIDPSRKLTVPGALAVARNAVGESTVGRTGFWRVTSEYWSSLGPVSPLEVLTVDGETGAADKTIREPSGERAALSAKVPVVVDNVDRSADAVVDVWGRWLEADPLDDGVGARWVTLRWSRLVCEVDWCK
jgi:hypothetical protein